MFKIREILFRVYKFFRKLLGMPYTQKELSDIENCLINDIFSHLRNLRLRNPNIILKDFRPKVIAEVTFGGGEHLKLFFEKKNNQLDFGLNHPNAINIIHLDMLSQVLTIINNQTNQYTNKLLSLL